MNWYKNHSKEWKEIIETVAREIGRTELMVEKDTVQSMFLSELSKAELPFVFKGGTSLSKAYNMIDRFSEDIDLSMNRKPTESERKASKELVIQIAESLGMTLGNPDKIRSRYDYNKYVFKYMSLFVSMPVEIIIETSYYQTAYNRVY
ncbi:MAG: nucleotidyl transferase AbiEii/AbiGii toxin family protein [Suilimivivens sp.]